MFENLYHEEEHDGFPTEKVIGLAIVVAVMTGS